MIQIKIFDFDFVVSDKDNSKISCDLFPEGIVESITLFKIFITY